MLCSSKSLRASLPDTTRKPILFPAKNKNRAPLEILPRGSVINRANKKIDIFIEYNEVRLKRTSFEVLDFNLKWHVVVT